MRGHEERALYEFTRGKLQAANAALQDLARMSHVHFTNPRVLADLRRKYEPQRKQDRAKLNEFHIEQ